MRQAPPTCDHAIAYAAMLLQCALRAEFMETKMDWDEPISGSNQPMALGEVLDRLSLEELRSRIEALKRALELQHFLR